MPIMQWLGRWLLRAAYLGLLAGLFGVAAYVGFSSFVRRGVTPVPDLSGLSLEEAGARVADRGLELRHRAVEDRFSDRVPEQHVLEQTPSGGSFAKRGGWVEVILSRGERTVTMPDLTGKVLPSALVTLAAAGLTDVRSGQVLTGQGEPGTIVGQSPPAEERVGRDGAVRLFVAAEALGATYVMPDLVNRDYSQVLHFLEFHGFRVGSVKYEPYEGIARELVLRQYPLPGHPLREGEVVSLVVAAVSKPAPIEEIL